MARRGFNFEFDFSALEEFGEEMGTAEERFRRNGITGMQTYSMLAEEGSRALAPRDEGDLESSIQAEAPQWNGDDLEGGVFSNLQYALRRHEDPEREGQRDKYDNGVKEEDYYEDGRGRRTRQKEPWRGERAGNKFMDRAVTVTEDDFEKIMADDVLGKTLGGR